MEMKETTTISNLLGEVRKKRNITQVSVAEKLHCSRNNISKLESAESLTEKIICRYASAIGCKVKVEIIDEDTEEVYQSGYIY